MHRKATPLTCCINVKHDAHVQGGHQVEHADEEL